MTRSALRWSLNMRSSTIPVDNPESVEEAGALLGATITRCGREHIPSVSPPPGMPSAFASVQPAAPSAELLTRLYNLRSFLRALVVSTSASSTTSSSSSSKGIQHQPLVAAPSLLAVLMKLLPVSTSIATRVNAAPVAANSGCSFDTPPMLSIPLRNLWSDCVMLCHVLGSGLTGSTKIDTIAFVRQLATVASTNPRSARAAGGVRIAALEVIGKLFTNLPSPLAPWSLEILQLCLRALRSAGNGEPAYRVAAMQMACATAIACRDSYLKRTSSSSSYMSSSGNNNNKSVLLKGAMEDKAILESVKVIRQAITDKFPEVRSAAAHFASLLAPLLVHSVPSEVPGNNLLYSMDDVMSLATKNLDDEAPFVADGWAEALARCITTAIEYQEQLTAAGRSVRRDADTEHQDADGTSTSSASGGGGGPTSASPSSSAGASSDADSSRFNRNKNLSLAQSCGSLGMAIHVLVDQFVKAGGELAASRAGGTFSVGGRNVRVGLALALTKLLRLHSVLFGSLSIGSGEDRGGGAGLSIKQVVERVLRMLGEEMEKQLRAPVNTESAGGGGAGQLFGGHRVRSKGDPSLARMAACRVLREGLSEVSPEPVQLAILHDLLTMLMASQKATVPSATALNANQLQVLLVEISCLLSTLGEAACATVEDAVAALSSGLSHKEHGVRHEAAIACCALASSFPTEGRKLLRLAMSQIQLNHAELVTASMSPGKSEEQSSGLRMFRRQQKEQQIIDNSLPHQFAIHGWSLMASLLIKDLPRLPGGMPTELFDIVLSVAEILISFQFNEALAAANPGAVCLCVRAGFTLISGMLSTGPNSGVASHMAVIFGAWQKSTNSAKNGSKNFAPRHDLFCLDGVLSSIVVFLKYCSELLLSIPDALSQVTILLEDSIQLFSPQGRFTVMEQTPPVIARMESAKASILDAFAWLPSGSFPMAADGVFDLAANCIRESIEGDVTCSILYSLVSKEDSILDSKTACGAKREGQLGGARDMEETIVSLTGEAVLHGERESVILMLPWAENEEMDDSSCCLFLESAILGVFASDREAGKAPTPLHEVGSWRKPFDPSSSSKVRLIDSAIEAFAASFGLRSGKEQHVAMTMLESLVPPLLAQLARTLGVNTSLTEQDRRPKAKEDNAAVANITAVILSCLKSIPQYESTHNIAMSLGPQWMSMAKDLLLTLLPSVSSIVRRAAAEGLALLATLGVSEDAHFMQSTVLHSLDEVMQGHKPDGKPRTIALEPISAARSGALLTLASIQRTAQKVAERQLDKARQRARSYGDDEIISGPSMPKEGELPLLQMMSRILPSVAFHGMFRDYFIVRTYALHSFALLLSYSSRMDESNPDEVDLQLLRKSLEIVEGNFGAAWTSATSDFDRGQEAEKMASEVGLLVVLLRLMTLLLPFLHYMLVEHPDIARRFTIMAVLILENHASHPVVYVEAMAFFEVLALHPEVMPARSTVVTIDQNPLSACVPFLVGLNLRPNRFAAGCTGCDVMSLASPRRFRAAARAAKMLTTGQLHLSLLSDMNVVSGLLSSLEMASASRFFIGSTFLRNMAASKEVELMFAEWVALEKELLSVVPSLLLLERGFVQDYPDILLRWLLLMRAVLSGTTQKEEADDDTSQAFSRLGAMKSASLRAAKDASFLYTPRWQVKVLAARLASEALEAAAQHSDEAEIDRNADPNLDFRSAIREFSRLCRDAQQAHGPPPPSKIVFHVEELVSSACIGSAATLDHSELRALQGASLLFLDRLVATFGKTPDPEQPESSILDQYATQIFSAIKHSLGAADESDGEDALRLFSAGCDSLETILSVELTTDPIVLKRLLRPTIPTADQTPFFASTGCPATVGMSLDSAITNLVDARAASLVLICKVASTAKLFSRFAGCSMGSILDKIKSELLPSGELNLAVQAAAVAVDGARLLFGSKLTLAGKRLGDKDKRRSPLPVTGYLYQNIRDVSDSVMSLMVRSWSTCACYAMGPLLKQVALAECDESTREACWEWVKVIFPFFLSGIFDADEALRNTTENEAASSWADDALDASSVLVDCLRGVQTVVRECPPSRFPASWNDHIEAVLDRVSVLVPSLVEGSTTETRPSSALVSEVCSLLRHLASSSSVSVGEDSSLLICLLQPLDLLQQGKIDFQGNPHASAVVSTCLLAMGRLIDHNRVPDIVVHATTQLVLQSVLGKSTTSSKQSVGSATILPAAVVEGAEDLLIHCLRHDSMEAHKSRTAICLAKECNWPAWSAVVSADDSGAALLASIDSVRQSLANVQDPQQQLETLSSLVGMIPKATPAWVGCVMSNLGADVMSVLLTYGTTNQLPEAAQVHRKTACADALKLLLVGYQQLTKKTSDDDEIAMYLLVLFECLLALLRFNGLPNHPSPQGDVSLGRMSAQAILTIARTTPLSFKSSIAQLGSDNDRALVEFAVRAEMSGYATATTAATQEPVKKKLNVAGFKR